ncbi:TRAP transporter substrate-binding protein, partial [Escherichia coli]|nr:TRAP transporter substrate-binding protein [Escherichia coli]EFB4963886.1 TRAP transporter substrate-binding protein [Escherichia coli]EFJ9081056.1 TRAP transporter substrate-binding protein [Escherichia coli]EFL8489654.1 TRAP transporter substrate-binding protein [Escherichia coli]EFM5509438.1 TRAP transporter substrate-binding protein [Escherichia coli]
IMDKKVFALCSLSLALMTSSAYAKTLRVGYNHPNDHPTGMAMLKFAELVQTYTNGEYTVRTYPNGQLGDERRMLEQVQTRMLDITKTATTLMTTYAPEYSVLTMPYTFNNADHFKTVMYGDIGQGLLMKAESRNLIGMTFLYDEPRSYYTVKKAVTTPNDLKGLKIRVMDSADAIEVAQTMGATPTPLSWSEVYTALQQGVVDGAEGGPSALTLSRHGDVAKHFSNSKHVLYPGMIVINKSLWQGMSENHKTAFKRAASEAAEYQMKLFLKLEQDAMQGMKEMGVTVSEPDIAAFRQKSQAYVDKFTSEPNLKTLITQIRAAQ